MRARELNSIMLTRLSWRTRTVNLLTHRHAITRTWAVMYPRTFKFNVWYLNICDHPIEIHISAFHLRHLCISTRLVKATHNIKTSLIKQCYTCYAWTGATDTADTDMLLILILLGYVCSILHALCSVLDQYMFHYCIMLKIMLLLNPVPLKLNKSNIWWFHQILWNHSKHSFFIKHKQFQHDIFSNNFA
jgi:hypothetical protein